MTLGNALREVAEMVDGLESEGVTVEEIDVGGADGGGVPVSLQLRLSNDDRDVIVETGAEGSSSSGDSGTDDDRTEAKVPEYDDESSEESQRGRDTGKPSSEDVSGPPEAKIEDTAAAAASVSNDKPVAIEADGSATTDAPDETSEAEEIAGAETENDTEEQDLVPCRVSSCEETFESEHGMKIHAAKSHDVEESGNEQPHRDPERLREVYEAYETFDEMRDALDTDVTAQTVRRNMMNHGIHEPGKRLDVAARQRVNSDGGRGTDSEATETSRPTRSDSSSSESAPSKASDGADDLGTDPNEATSGEDEVDEHESGELEATESEVEDPEGVDRESGDSEVVDPESGDSAAVDHESEESETDAEAADEDEPPEPPEPTIEDVDLPEEFALPEGISLEDVVEAVESSETLFAVQRALDMDRPTAQELLATLDLLELVHGRVRTKHERDRDKEAIIDRITQAVEDESMHGPDDRVLPGDQLSADD